MFTDITPPIKETKTKYEINTLNICILFFILIISGPMILFSKVYKISIIMSKGLNYKLMLFIIYWILTKKSNSLTIEVVVNNLESKAGRGEMTEWLKVLAC